MFISKELAQIMVIATNALKYITKPQHKEPEPRDFSYLKNIKIGNAKKGLFGRIVWQTK
jgi:hypothetical protein